MTAVAPLPAAALGRPRRRVPAPARPLAGPLQLVRLDSLMRRGEGDPRVIIGLIDGPVATGHPDLAHARIRDLGGPHAATCTLRSHPACIHGTFVAGILSARRGGSAPAICPGCTLAVRTVFSDRGTGAEAPDATPREVAEAIRDCVAAGARVINISAALYESRAGDARPLTEALDHAARRGVIVVVAAGNDAAIGSTTLTGHPWVIPVVAATPAGGPTARSNLGRSIGGRGLAGPGDAVTSLGPQGAPLTLGGTSVAAPFVSGAIALLMSLFPTASAVEVRVAIGSGSRRRALVPPLLDAEAAHETLTRRGPHA